MHHTRATALIAVALLVACGEDIASTPQMPQPGGVVAHGDNFDRYAGYGLAGAPPSGNNACLESDGPCYDQDDPGPFPTCGLAAYSDQVVVGVLKYEGDVVWNDDCSYDLNVRGYRMVSVGSYALLTEGEIASVLTGVTMIGGGSCPEGKELVISIKRLMGRDVVVHCVEIERVRASGGSYEASPEMGLAELSQDLQHKIEHHDAECLESNHGMSREDVEQYLLEDEGYWCNPAHDRGSDYAEEGRDPNVVYVD